ncbi:MAG: RCC1 domain-containing protein [Candidatus Methylacidiphilales bacterium]|nr:hypothetical protein [Candidatus Methylacidiphilales bacterium]
MSNQHAPTSRRSSLSGNLVRCTFAAALLAFLPGIDMARAQVQPDATGVIVYSKAVGVEAKPREFRSLGTRVGLNQPISFAGGGDETLNYGNIRVIVLYSASVLPTIRTDAEATRARTELKRLEDTAARYPTVQPYLAKAISTLKSDVERFDGGSRKVEGKWLTAAEYQQSLTERTTTSRNNDRQYFSFTAKDKKKHENIYVSRVDEDSIVVTSDFGASRVRWELLPDDLSSFPQDVQDRRANLIRERTRQMRDMRNRLTQSTERLRSQNLSLISWGDMKAPEDLVQVVDVGIGRTHGVAVHKDGTLTTWGVETVATVPEPVTDAAKVSVGEMHSIVLRKNGTVYCWGNSGDGRCTPPTGLRNVVAVAAGGRHSLALTSEGKVYAWGSNVSGQCNVPIGLEYVVAIAAGANHSVALTAEGNIIAWGDGARGQITVPKSVRDVGTIAVGNNHNVAMLNNGTVVAWGDNSVKQCVLPMDMKSVSMIAAGGDSSLALTPERIIGWGDNSHQQAMPNIAVKPVFVAVGPVSGVAMYPAPERLQALNTVKPTPPAPAPTPAPVTAPAPTNAGGTTNPAPTTSTTTPAPKTDAPPK